MHCKTTGWFSLQSHLFPVQPTQLYGPIFCLSDTWIYVAPKRASARLCSYDRPGPGIFDWWQMKVCFSVPINILVRYSPQLQTGIGASWTGEQFLWLPGVPFHHVHHWLIALSPAASCLPTCHHGQLWWYATVCVAQPFGNHLVVIGMHVASNLWGKMPV